LDFALEAFQKLLPKRYEIVRELGRGGMGQVLLAIDRGPLLDSSNYVAIKRMLGTFPNHSREVQQFLEEVEKARTLRSPHVVRMYHSDNTILGPYIVMEYIKGEDLGKYIDRHGRLSEELALDWFQRIAEALDEGHGKNLIHRDLKPKNILIRKDGKPILVDFGISRHASERDQTGTGLGAGTPAYMSPEQLENRAPTIRQDIYSFGATLYHAVEGRPPFQEENFPRLLVKVMSEKAPRAKRVSAELARRIESCLEKAPADRPESCGKVLMGLSGSHRQSSPPTAISPSNPASQAVSTIARRSRANVWRSLAMSILLIFLGLIVGFLLLRKAESQRQTPTGSLPRNDIPSKTQSGTEIQGSSEKPIGTNRTGEEVTPSSEEADRMQDRKSSTEKAKPMTANGDRKKSDTPELSEPFPSPPNDNIGSTLSEVTPAIKKEESPNAAKSETLDVREIAESIPEDFRDYLIAHPALLTADSAADITYLPQNNRWLIIAVGSSLQSKTNPKVACKLKAYSALAEIRETINLKMVAKLNQTGATQEIVATLQAKTTGLPLLGEWKSADGESISVLYGVMVENP
jgi:serine/threonine protein kinase